MRLFFDRHEANNFRVLLARFGPGALASPYRSTLPLLCLVKDASPAFRRLVAACGCAGDLSVHFEYQVAVPGVPGNPSQTDAMVVSDGCTVALEAKWTEPRYETLEHRLRTRIAKLSRDDPDNAASHTTAQRAIVTAWLRLLERHAQGALSIEKAGGAIYQMVHRAASACAMPAACALVYLHFEPSPSKSAAPRAKYIADLAHLHGLLGSPHDFPFYLVTMPLSPTAAFNAIRNLAKRKIATDLKVRDSLLRTRLFAFGDPRVERVG